MVDTGDFHIQMCNGDTKEVEIYKNLPICFKIDLSDFMSPMTLNIKYVYEKPKDPSQKSSEHKETLAFGSFRNLHPNSENCDFKYKYPR